MIYSTELASLDKRIKVLRAATAKVLERQWSPAAGATLRQLHEETEYVVNAHNLLIQAKAVRDVRRVMQKETSNVGK
jgi:hypothetical protein